MALLIDRFVSRWSGAQTLGNELIYAGPRRQQQMLRVAETQVEAQRAAAQRVAKSNIDGAQIIARELNQQTVTLVDAIDDLRLQLSDDIALGSAQVSAAVDHLGDRVCASLDELKWLNIQQIGRLDAVLATLLESRNNLARQLVKQGVRHFITGEYQEAEDRFKLALIEDPIDYQVLMNLGYLALQKDDASEAQKYFMKALTLPESLEDESRSRALWALARLHYTQGRFDEALRTADSALGLKVLADPGHQFEAAIYASLTGSIESCCQRVKAAIHSDQALFARAAVDPDLEGSRTQVEQLLSDLACEASESATKLVSGLEGELGQARRNSLADAYSDAISRFEHETSKLRALLETPSYSASVQIAARSRQLSSILFGTLAIDGQYQFLGAAQQQVADAEHERANAARRAA